MSETQTAPKTSEIRAWLVTNRPDLQVGKRGYLAKEAVNVYREAHDLPVEG